MSVPGHRRRARRSSPAPSRRSFLGAIGAAASVMTLPACAAGRARRADGLIRIGLIADLHHDLMHDGEARLDAFLAAAVRLEVDCLVQLGDFAYPSSKNRAVIEKFNAAPATSLHVIGNHDTDSGHSRQQCIDVWGMSGRYYARDLGALRVLVLDGNDAGSPTHRGGYPAFVGPEQQRWLEEQLAGHAGPFLIASHQPLAGAWAVDNAVELQALLGRHADKIVLCVNGHSHLDQLVQVAGVPYLHVNSASYYWVGGAHRHPSYPPEIHEQHPWIDHTCPYREAVFSVLSIDPAAARVDVAGCQSEWVGPTPQELGIELPAGLVHGEHVAPRTRRRRIGRALGS